MTPEYDCIIVGAGLSGLAAGERLLSHSQDLRILVLEARDRIGGRVNTVSLNDQKYWDVGGTFLGAGHDLMYDFARRYNIETHPIPTKGKIVQYRKGQARSYSGLIPPMRPMTVFRLAVSLAQLERKIKQIDTKAPWAHPKAKKWDNISAKQWLRRKSKTNGAEEVWELACRMIFGRSSDEVSLLHFMFVFRSLGSVDAALSSEGGLQQHILQGGSIQIADKLCAHIGGAHVVKLGEPVNKVTYGEGLDDACTVSTALSQYKCKRVILSVPLSLVSRIEFEPKLPSEKQKLIDGTSMGAYSKALAIYKTPFWREAGLRGEVTGFGYAGCVFDVTGAEPSAEGKLVAFLGGSKAIEFAKLSTEQKQEVILEEFEGMFGSKARQVTGFHYHTMLDEEWSSGCPMAGPGLGVWSKYGQWLRRPIGPIHWAGAETSERHYGYMEGAVHTGQRAADEVAESLNAL